MKFSFKQPLSKLPLPRTIAQDAQRVYKALQSGSTDEVEIHDSEGRKSAYKPKEALKRVFDIATKKLAWLKARDTSAFADGPKTANAEGIDLVDSLLDACVSEFGEQYALKRQGVAPATPTTTTTTSRGRAAKKKTLSSGLPKRALAKA